MTTLDQAILASGYALTERETNIFTDGFKRGQKDKPKNESLKTICEAAAEEIFERLNPPTQRDEFGTAMFTESDARSRECSKKEYMRVMLPILTRHLQPLADREAEARRLLEEVRDYMDCLEIPPKNCSCFISPPCHDCVEFSHIREFVAAIKSYLSVQPAK